MSAKGRVCRHCGSPARGNPCWGLPADPNFDPPCYDDSYHETIAENRRANMRFGLGVLIFGALACLGVLLAMGYARADEADLRAEFFQKAKSALLVNGTTVNCCGEGDAVRVRLIGHDHARELIIAEIIDVMRSLNGKVGDILTIPAGKVTVGLYSPFDEPIAFISGNNTPYCLSGPSGG